MARPAAPALIAGKEKFTDPQYIAVFKELASWAPYMGNGFQAQKYPDSQNLFSLGKARDLSRRLVGHLDLPRPGASSRWAPSRRRCRPATRNATSPTTPTSAMGVNSASKNKEDAKKFLEWLTTPEFATLYANALPGFFPLSKDAGQDRRRSGGDVRVGWRKECKSTIRNSYQILSRGTPNLENELWNVSAQVINGTLTPEAAGKQLQDGLDKWYKPAK